MGWDAGCAAFFLLACLALFPGCKDKLSEGGGGALDDTAIEDVQADVSIADAGADVAIRADVAAGTVTSQVQSPMETDRTPPPTSRPSAVTTPQPTAPRLTAQRPAPAAAV